MICPEGEEDMHRKPSRFEFINKMRQKQDEREQAAIDSTKAYLEKNTEFYNEVFEKIQEIYKSGKAELPSDDLDEE